MMAQHLMRDGLRLAVSRTGSGALFVFQHGLCGDAAQPAQVFPLDSGYECLTLECRGHGGSEAGEPFDFSIATFADDVAALIESVSKGPVVLGGISMGASISLRLAVLRPDLVRALVLARPAWLLSRNPDNMAPNAFAGQLLQQHEARAARQLFDASPVVAQLAAEAPDNLASLRGFFTREPVQVTADLLRRISADGPGVSEDEVRAITVPTLVIGHARDAIHPLAYATTLACLIPQAQFAEITPKADSAERYRADFHSVLSNFLKGL
jgi:pimeloyl-ACP methyl ester carboxylesterase